MKATIRIGKGSAKHNTHSFKAEHIDNERTKNNIYWTYKNGITEKENLILDEKAFYEENYTDYLNRQNEKYRQRRQYKKIKNMEEYQKATPLDEVLLQIGKMEDTVDFKILQNVVDDFIKNIQSEYDKNVHVVSWALHNDEATPHIHLRLAYDYQNKENIKQFGIDKALTECGFKVQGKEDRFNNKKIAFTDKLRNDFYNLCDLYLVENDKDLINRTVENPSHRHLKTELFKAQKQQEENERNEVYFNTQIEKLKKQIEQLEAEKEEAHKYYNDKKMTFKEVKEDIDKNFNDAVESYKKSKDEELENEKNIVAQDFQNKYEKFVREEAKTLTQKKTDYKMKSLEELGLSGYDTIKIDNFSR